ncbi:MAG: 2-C-methyl-D-erythritol 2,4-cyclodiphosphate synthase [Zavarzinella sp.]
MEYRVGSGHDTHRLVAGRPLILGGVKIDYHLGLDGHSDADIVLHALTDAILGAAGLGDIGDAFPDTDPANFQADSQIFLDAAINKVSSLGCELVNADITIFAQVPKLGPVKEQIRTHVAEILHLPTRRVNVKAKTGENVGHIGRKEALGCHVVVLLKIPTDDSAEHHNN